MMGIYDTYNFGTGSWSGNASDVTGGFILGGDGSSVDSEIFNGTYVNDLIGSFDSDPIFGFDLGVGFTSGDDFDPLDSLYASIGLGDGDLAIDSLEPDKFIPLPSGGFASVSQDPYGVTGESSSSSSTSTSTSGTEGQGSASGGSPSANTTTEDSPDKPKPTEEKGWWERQSPQAQSAIIGGLFNAAGGFFKGLADAKARKEAANLEDKRYKRNRDDKLADDERIRKQTLEDRAILWAREDLTSEQKYQREKELLNMRLSSDVNVANIRSSGDAKNQGGASTFSPGLIRPKG